MGISVQPISVAPCRANVSFSGGAKDTERKGSLGKAVASAIVPGLGQACDGRYKSGLKHFVTVCALPTVGAWGTLFALSRGSKVGNIAAGVIAIGSAIGTLAAYIHGITDAYRGGKKA